MSLDYWIWGPVFDSSEAGTRSGIHNFLVAIGDDNRASYRLGVVVNLFPWPNFPLPHLGVCETFARWRRNQIQSWQGRLFLQEGAYELVWREKNLWGSLLCRKISCRLQRQRGWGEPPKELAELKATDTTTAFTINVGTNAEKFCKLGKPKRF